MMQISEPRATLSIDAIQAMLNAAVARAKEVGVKVHITILDQAGNMAGFISFPGTPRIAETTAYRKAFTAVHMGQSTEQWERYLGTVPPSELKIIDSIPGYVAAIGGLPIRENGLVLGGIGVSGWLTDQQIEAVTPKRRCARSPDRTRQGSAMDPQFGGPARTGVAGRQTRVISRPGSAFAIAVLKAGRSAMRPR